jgi:hypothetical protein
MSLISKAFMRDNILARAKLKIRAESFLQYGFLRTDPVMGPELVVDGDILRPQLYEVLCLRK